MVVRGAEKKDIDEIMSIYNYEVINGVATLDIKPKTKEYFLSWFESHDGNHPIFVACENNEVVGYACLSLYREKEAFISTAEVSVYVSHKHRNKGTATALLRKVIAFAQENDTLKLLVSVITAGNEVSKHLHEKFDFKYCGTIHKSAYKMGEYRDIDNYELILW